MEMERKEDFCVQRERTPFQCLCLISLMFREACKVGKTSIKGAGLKNEGDIKSEGALGGCCDERRLKGQDAD